jgi:hypothetical protein
MANFITGHIGTIYFSSMSRLLSYNNWLNLHRCYLVFHKMCITCPHLFHIVHKAYRQSIKVLRKIPQAVEIFYNPPKFFHTTGEFSSALFDPSQKLTSSQASKYGFLRLITIQHYSLLHQLYSYHDLSTGNARNFFTSTLQSIAAI